MEIQWNSFILHITQANTQSAVSFKKKKKARTRTKFIVYTITFLVFKGMFSIFLVFDNNLHKASWLQIFIYIIANMEKKP